MDDFTRDMPSREYAGGKMLAAKADGVGVVTFNQPEKHNAMSVEMWRGLADILDDFREDASVRTVILTGAGTRAFVSGADISQRSPASAATAWAAASRWRCRLICGSPMPAASWAF